jgi:hypothetical protein
VSVVRITDATWADWSRLGQSGVVTKVGRVRGEEPFITVRFSDGKLDDFFPDELSVHARLQPEMARRARHGTRARYVSGCRCAPCKVSNARCYHARMARRHAEAADVVPSGPPLFGELVRAGKVHKIKRCPGANGKRCIAGGAWLRQGGGVCAACIERATVWNGLVDAAPVRRHLRELSRQGIGYKSVAAAADVGKTLLARVLSRRQLQLRARAARRVLGVEAGAIADHATVPAASTWKRLRRLLREGFSKRELARRLGSRAKSPALQVQRGRVLAKTALKVERFYNSIMQG